MIWWTAFLRRGNRGKQLRAPSDSQGLLELPLTLRQQKEVLQHSFIVMVHDYGSFTMAHSYGSLLWLIIMVIFGLVDCLSKERQQREATESPKSLSGAAGTAVNSPATDASHYG